MLSKQTSNNRNGMSNNSCCFVSAKNAYTSENVWGKKRLCTLSLTTMVLGWLPIATASADSECLNRASSNISVRAAGSYSNEFDQTPPRDFYTYDMRGVMQYANEPLRPITVRQILKGACVVGPKVVGQQSRKLTWDQMKDQWDGDGVRFVPDYYNQSINTFGTVTLEGAWIENVEDGFEPVRSSTAAGRGYSWALRHSYFRYIRDDVIENDACHPGEVNDVLVDDSFMFLASRPGSGNYLSTGRTAPVMKVYNSLVHVGAASQPGGKLFKWPGSSSDCTPRPRVDVRNTVFRIDVKTSNMEFPAGTYDNVTLVYLGSGSYPAAIPSGVRVTKDVNVWNQARAQWIANHGCDANMTRCTSLLDPIGQ